MTAELKISPEVAKAELWRRGYLGWKLFDFQMPMYQTLHRLKESQQQKGFFRTSRRMGKSFDFLVFGTERGSVEDGIIIPYVAPSIKHLKTIATPIMNTILADCPADMRPKFYKQDGIFEFPKTESILMMAASENGHAEKCRGIKAKYVLLDECGVIKDLKNLVNDIMIPTLMFGDGGGFVVGSGTPPPTPDHYYTELAAECEASGFFVHMTIWENTRLDVRETLQFCQDLGCVIDWERFSKEHTPETRYDKVWGQSLIIFASNAYKRELLAEIVIDEQKAVIPEMSGPMGELVIKEWERPEFCHKWVVMDTGFIDYTGVVFGYWDFKQAKAVVEDELLVDFRSQGMNAKKLAELCLEKEKELWGDEKPYLRFGDGDLIVLNELSEHGFIVQPVSKDEVEAQVNQVRVDITQQKAIITPNCVNLIAHAKYAIWNRQRNAFARTQDHGHYDMLAAWIYFLRHINRAANPWPAFYGVKPHNQYVPEGYGEPENTKALKKIFSLS